MSWSLRLVIWLLPVGLAAALSQAIATTLDWSIDRTGQLLLVAGVLAAYAGDRFRDGDLPMPAWIRGALATCTLVAACGAGLILWRWAPQLWPACLLLAAITLGYPWCRRLPWGKTLAVAVSWMLACLVLPFAESGSVWQPLLSPMAWVVFGLIVAGTLLYDLKDVDLDRDEPGVLQMLGESGLRFCVAGALVFVSTILLWQAWWWWWPPVLGLALLAAWPGSCRHRLWGPALVDGVLMLPVLGALC